MYPRHSVTHYPIQMHPIPPNSPQFPHIHVSIIHSYSILSIPTFPDAYDIFRIFFFLNVNCLILVWFCLRTKKAHHKTTRYDKSPTMMASQQQQEEGQVQEQPGNPSTNGSKLSLEQLTVQLRSYATQLVQVQRRAYGYGMDDDEDMGNAFGFTIQDILASLTAVKYSIIGKIRSLLVLFLRSKYTNN